LETSVTVDIFWFFDTIRKEKFSFFARLLKRFFVFLPTRILAHLQAPQASPKTKACKRAKIFQH